MPDPGALPHDFHPAVTAWFGAAFPAPTPAQAAAWPAIRAGRHVLVSAPTGSGKTLTAFLAVIDGLVHEGLANGGALPAETRVVYVSPLKALSNDIRLNLEVPLAGIRCELARLGLPDVEIRSAVRTGDTPQNERRQSLREPPHILVTTPESLYVLLGSASGRSMLGTVRGVIVDEIHALAPNKRGSHLALSLERLQTLCARPLTRIGLSATQKPIDEVARFLVGAAAVTGGIADCEIVDVGAAKRRDFALELPPSPLGPVMSNDQWGQVYARVAELAALHRTTLVFVNTRRMAERATRHLGELLGRDAVAAHHGSLAKELRLDAESRLKAGALKLLVATASLELGLDIGDVDLVCQLGSPHSIASFLQRAGRAGHAVDGVARARLFPQSRDDLIECAALLDAIGRGELDTLRVPPAPLDVLAQQVVAETACRDWDETELYGLVRRAWPYAQLARAQHDAVVQMLAQGFATRNGLRAAYVHHDAVHQRLRERRGARMTALTSGGTIPETGDYAVLLEPQAHTMGSVNEDFAVESLAGDVFQLGNTSYRILRIEPGRVRVEDAHGAAPNIPFWLGEAPARSDALSGAVARLRGEAGTSIATRGRDEALRRIEAIVGVGADAARQIVDYMARALAALGVLPTQREIVFERFFDASGGMQLVVHAPFGSRVNRAWGLALRKRFCRKFNFELQAAATEDAIVLSLSAGHSFPLEEVPRYLHSQSARDVLVQALLDAPLFGVRWRWNATTALALPRFAGGRKVAPQLQRMRSQDLLAAVFPDQVACVENLAGAREVPDHPLVAQTLADCLEDAMDAEGWLALLRRIECGEVAVHTRDLTTPSPLAAEVLNARPYAFLDDAPLEERRTQAVQLRRATDAGSTDDLGRLDEHAIRSVCEEAWPEARHADEMHEALLLLGAVTDAESAREPGWLGWLDALARAGRAARLVLPDASGERGLWFCTERLAHARVLFGCAAVEPPIDVPADFATPAPERDAVLRELLRCRLAGLGPVAADVLAGSLCLPQPDIDAALAALQNEGVVLQGRFTPGTPKIEWCERHLLARIHRYTLKQLRREIEPVEPRDFMRFLFEWQHVGLARLGGSDALPAVLAQLEGYEAAAATWEPEILSARLQDYSAAWLDELCTSGRTTWARLRPGAETAGVGGARGSLRAMPVVLLPRRAAPFWTRLAGMATDNAALGAKAQRVAAFLAEQGASFFDEIVQGCRMLKVEAEEALAEAVVRGRVTCDSFAGLRALLVPPSRRDSDKLRQRRRAALFGIEDAGRWSLTRAPVPLEAARTTAAAAEDGEQIVHTLLRRYGVLCWRLLEREAAWLPRWSDLVRVCRRLEARGDIRGGRFIAGLSGEQFALPEAVALMREVRRRPADGRWLCLSAADPANLLGTIVPGSKAPRIAGSRVLYRDGVPAAISVGGEVQWLDRIEASERGAASKALLLGPARATGAAALPFSSAAAA